MAKLHKFNLYGVRTASITASATDDAEFASVGAAVDIEIEAPADIEADLLDAGLKLRGFTSQQVQQFRAVLKDKDLRAKLEKLMLEPTVNKIIGGK